VSINLGVASILFCQMIASYSEAADPLPEDIGRMGLVHRWEG